jgi:hypothetical protein
LDAIAEEIMKAIRIHENGGPEVMRWEDCELPPPGSGEVRLRHTARWILYSRAAEISRNPRQ